MNAAEQFAAHKIGGLAEIYIMQREQGQSHDAAAQHCRTIGSIPSVVDPEFTYTAEQIEEAIAEGARLHDAH